jgi:hypothetical protein
MLPWAVQPVKSRLFRNIQYDPSVSFPMGRTKAMKIDVGGIINDT